MFGMLAAGSPGGGGALRLPPNANTENVAHLKAFVKMMREKPPPPPPPPVLPIGPARTEGGEHVPWYVMQQQAKAARLDRLRRRRGGKHGHRRTDGDMYYGHGYREDAASTFGGLSSGEEAELELLTRPMAHAIDPRRTRLMRSLSESEQAYVDNAMETCETARVLAAERARLYEQKVRAAASAMRARERSHTRRLSRYVREEAAAKRDTSVGGDAAAALPTLPPPPSLPAAASTAPASGRKAAPDEAAPEGEPSRPLSPGRPASPGRPVSPGRPTFSPGRAISPAPSERSLSRSSLLSTVRSRGQLVILSPRGTRHLVTPRSSRGTHTPRSSSIDDADLPFATPRGSSARHATPRAAAGSFWSPHANLRPATARV